MVIDANQNNNVMKCVEFDLVPRLVGMGMSEGWRIMRASGREGNVMRHAISGRRRLKIQRNRKRARVYVRTIAFWSGNKLEKINL